MTQSPTSSTDKLETSVWRKKPVEIEAFQLTMDVVISHVIDKKPLPFGVKISSSTCHPKNRTVEHFGCYIDTEEGRMRAVENDWIIRGIKGELYPCKPDIFAATYEPAIAHRPEAGEIEALYHCRQHVGWLKQYALSMEQANWRDMKDRIIGQLDKLSNDLSRIPSEEATEKERRKAFVQFWHGDVRLGMTATEAQSSLEKALRSGGLRITRAAEGDRK